jgi:Na+/H+ antiporter NhaD/arsenite permease-like protein
VISLVQRRRVSRAWRTILPTVLSSKKRSRLGPLMLLAAVTFSSGLFSAFLLNDAICLVMTPLVADISHGKIIVEM